MVYWLARCQNVQWGEAEERACDAAWRAVREETSEMRKQLAAHAGERITVRGTVERFGTKPAFRGPPLRTVLLVNLIGSDDRPLCHHLWLNVTKQIEAANLQRGDVVEFHARAEPYVKGYQGRRDDVFKPVEQDYKLARPTHVRKVSASDAAEV